MLFHIGDGSAFSVFVRKAAKFVAVAEIPTASIENEARTSVALIPLLLTLPDELLCGVLNLVWFNDIARLETALLRKDHRLVITNIAGRLHPNGDPRYLWDKRSLKWLASSTIRPTTVTLNGSVSDEDIVTAADALRCVEQLVFHKCGKLSTAGIVALSHCCDNLQSLKISTTQELSVECLMQLAVNAQNLRALNLSFVRGVASAGLTAILQCRPLEHLDLSGTNLLRIESILPWAQHIVGLKSLNLSSCACNAECLQILCLYCTNLTSLDLCGNASLNNDDITMAVTSCTNLTTLRIDGIWNLSQVTIAAIAQHLPQLTEFSMTGCFTRSVTSWSALFTQCTALQRLSVSDLPESDFFQCLTEHCPRLRHLTMERQSAFTEDGWSRIAQRLDRVVELQLPFEVATDRVLADIAACCPLLESLCMSQSVNVTPEAFWSLTRACRRLRKVNIRACPQFTDEAICALARNCPNLEELHLSKALLLTDVSVVTLARRCGNLRKLTLNYCAQLTDVSVEAVLAGCRRLAVLEVYGCEKIDRVRVFRAMQKVRWI